MKNDLLNGQFDLSGEEINLELLARQVVEGFITGLHKSPFHGFSVEFAEHRLYNSGESVKNIDWKLYGRSDKLFVKRFEEETNLRCQLVLDVSSSMYYPDKPFNKLVFSVCSIASLMYLFKRQRDAFGLSFFSDRLEFSSAAKSTGVHQKYLFAELGKILNREARGVRTSLPAALHEIAELLHKRSMVIIFTDMFESVISEEAKSAFFAALQHLKHNKHEVIVFNVLDHESEIRFEFGNQPYHFVDIETGQQIKLNPSQAREEYISSVDEFRKELTLRCAQYHIDLIDADISAGFLQVLQAYLIKRSRMNS
ncbi:DUF58 domain-containing protein [Pararcticibacter amylolyticus]|uniref:DUF58 domain-containing protein n=1 Tax=Pararcticibacter amylolyticus TaxID=2173175 RepID=A0A2U2PBT5_9SPHI|nr:DUF58 domain-containing protein [Pararcticibacter amylolyticus]PWG78866.1 DUF58 domain-containing protein [Pararcticibacter amylolyticus]